MKSGTMRNLTGKVEGETGNEFTRGGWHRKKATPDISLICRIDYARITGYVYGSEEALTTSLTK